MRFQKKKKKKPTSTYLPYFFSAMLPEAKLFFLPKAHNSRVTNNKKKRNRGHGDVTVFQFSILMQPHSDFADIYAFLLRVCLQLALSNSLLQLASGTLKEVFDGACDTKKRHRFNGKKKKVFSGHPSLLAKNPDTIFFFHENSFFFVWFKKPFNYIKCVESVAKCFSTDQKSHNIITFIAPYFLF